MRKWKLVLCAGRHKIPQDVDGHIFPAELTPDDMTSPGRLEIMAAHSIMETCIDICPDKYLNLSGIQIDLYVTGLTVALIAVLNVCRIEGITVTLWHFNRTTGEYYPQEVR